MTIYICKTTGPSGASPATGRRKPSGAFWLTFWLTFAHLRSRIRQGPDGMECPYSEKTWNGHPSPGNGWPAGQEDGHQAWHYFVDPCVSCHLRGRYMRSKSFSSFALFLESICDISFNRSRYSTQNSSKDGLGCDRTSHPGGTAKTALMNCFSYCFSLF